MSISFQSIKRRFQSPWILLGMWLLPFATSVHALDSTIPYEKEWWMKPQRMIQTNLREIDATMNLDDYISSLKEAGANVVLFNVGGIVANYPTDLPFQYRNPNMQGDLTAEVVKRLHAEGIRVIGRFDFSKVNETIARDHPEWLYISEKGETVTYNGQVHTCLNAGYQQECMFQILAEAIDRYPLDGIFFNMIGYPRRDYSGTYHGLCQCDSCRKRFREMYDLELPKTQKDGDPVYQRYQEFCRKTIDDQFLRVQALVKKKNPNLAICTYTREGVDITRSESNRPFGQGTYYDSDKARMYLLDNPTRMMSNAAVHFIHYPHRHSSVSPYLTQRRLLQHMVNGTWLDFYCIGPFHAQEDRFGLDQVRDIFQFHAANEAWMLDTHEVAEVGLAVDAARRQDEYWGFFKILSESHIPFDLVSLQNSDLSKYSLLIVPIVHPLRDEVREKLDTYVKQGGHLLLTGKVPDQLKCTGIEQALPVQAKTKGTYIRIRPEDKTILKQPDLDKVDLVFLEGNLWTYQVKEDVEGLLRYIPPAMFGPPEKCYYTKVSDIPCLYTRQFGKGSVAWFPWQIGRHYQQQGHRGHAALVRGVLNQVLKCKPSVIVDAPSLVEINHRRNDGKNFEWVSLINHTGLMENVLHEPVPLRDITIEVQTKTPVRSVSLLKAKQNIPFSMTQPGWIKCRVPELKAYEVVLFR